MSTEPPTPPTSADAHLDSGRVSRLLVIAGLCALAIAQPILDVFGRNPTTFRFNRIDDTGIVLFGLAVVVIPPLALWSIGEVVSALDRRAGRMAHAAIVGTLSGLFAVILAKGLTTSVVLTGGAGVLAMAVAAYAITRFPAFGTWSRVLSATNVLFLATFVFFSPVSDLIGANTQDTIEAVGEGTGLGESAPSVIMLVFDEWPTQSLLTSAGDIDASRFPNVAAFAEDATFYRHFTAVSPFTQSAVPALLDGLDPHGGPTWADHPDSLFSLLGASHHPIVAESITELCGLEECGLRPTPPPPPADGVEQDLAEATTSIDTDPRWGRLFDATVELWTDRVKPGADDGSRAFDDFVEEISPTAPKPAAPATPATQPSENADLERFLATQVIGQPDRHRLFVDALRPTDEPIFGFLHLVLPHQPWTLREDGTAYAVAGNRTDYEADIDDPWPVAVSRQRHLLQAEYSDRLLGDVLRRLEEIDEYDDSIIVVVADHGVAFEPGEPSRRLTEANLEQIVYAPLFIKAPGQTTATVDDSNINSTDIAPTIAEMLGVALPWDADGAAAGSAEITARGTAKYVYSFSDAFDYEFLGIVDYDDATAYPKMLDAVAPPLDADDESRLSGLYREIPGAELIGRSADEVFTGGSGTTSVFGLEQLERPDPDAPLLGEISGRVGADTVDLDETVIVVAVDDEIVGVSPLYERDGEPGHFVVLLPSDALTPSSNVVRVGRRGNDGVVTELAITGS